MTALQKFLKQIILKQVKGSVYLVPAIMDIQIEEALEEEKKQISKWIPVTERPPEIEDLPFLTIDRSGLYEAWDDSDWFDEICVEGRQNEYLYWVKIKPPNQL